MDFLTQLFNKAFNKRNCLYYSKSFSKIASVVLLAAFQVSFFMRPTIDKTVNRQVAQEIGTSSVINAGGYDIDLNVNPDEEQEVNSEEVPTEEVSIDEIPTEEVEITDLIPEVLPKKDKVKDALNNFNIKADQCLARANDVSDIDELLNNYKNTNNSNDRKYAYYELAQKLVKLELLEDFESGNNRRNTTNDDEFDLDLDSKPAKVKSSYAIFLDKDNADDFKEIEACHMDRISKLDTDEDKKAYFEKYIAGVYVDEMGNNLDQPKTLEDLANAYYGHAKNADQTTDNQYGLQYTAQAHAQASKIVSTYVGKIQDLQRKLAVNPNDQNTALEIENTKNQLISELAVVQNNMKAQATTALSNNPNDLNAATQSIDLAVNYWAGEAVKALSSGSSINLSSLDTTTNSTTSLAQLSTPTLDFLNNSNLDSNNLMANQSPTPNTAYRRSGIAIRNQIGNNFRPDQSRRPVVGQ